MRCDVHRTDCPGSLHGLPCHFAGLDPLTDGDLFYTVARSARLLRAQADVAGLLPLCFSIRPVDGRLHLALAVQEHSVLGARAEYIHPLEELDGD